MPPCVHRFGNLSAQDLDPITSGDPFWDQLGGGSEGSDTPTKQVSTEIAARQPGKMMWEEEFFAHAISVQGGLYTKEQAVSQWAKWKAIYDDTPESTEICWDLGGPRVEKPLQFRIPIGKFLDYDQRYKHVKEMTQTQKLSKDATEVA